MKNPYFTTSDWFLTIWLIAKGFEVKKIDRQNQSRCVFCFEENSKLTQEVKNFWQNEAVGVQDFVAATKKAKVLLYADSF